MKQYLRLLSRIHNTPLLLQAGKLEVITKAVTLPLLEGKAPSLAEGGEGRGERGTFSGKQKFALISIFDSLVTRNGIGASGFTSYEYISQSIDEAVLKGAEVIGFHIDTPGGEVPVFGLTEKIRNLSSLGIRTFSFCEMACSAGYALAAATDYIFASPTARIGSIAAVQVHAEASEKYKKEGVVFTILRSKPEKALGDPYTKLTSDVQNSMQKSLDKLDKIFNNDVIKSRSILTLEAIIGFKGRDFLSEEALQANLIDTITVSLERAITTFFLIKNTRDPRRKLLMTDKLETIDTIDTINTIDTVTNTEKIKLEAELNAAKGEYARITTILTTASTLGLTLQDTIKYISPKYSAEIAQEILTDLAELKEQKLSLDGVVGAMTEPEPNAAPQQNLKILKNAYSKATNNIIGAK